MDARPGSLLLRMGIFSDERKVEQSVGKVLVGHGGVGKHTGSGMALPDGPSPFLVAFEAQDIGVP